MFIEYRANKMRREVGDAIGKVLIQRGLARAVIETRSIEPELSDEEPAQISSRTGKPKRQYKRRDLRAEA